MKNFFKKAIVLFIAAAVTIGSLYGCKPRVIEKIIDTKTQLYIANYNGGVGKVWIENLKHRFEEAVKDVSYEPGKMGAQLVITNEKDTLNVSKIKDTIKSSSFDLYYAQGDATDEFVLNNAVYDITDIVKEPLEKYGESRSIEDKMSPAQVDNYLRSGRYYTLPHHVSYYGLVYDVDLFEGSKLFFAKNGAPSERLQENGSFSSYTYVGATGERSAGPDCEYGTYDDGVPATYEEFFELCKRMKLLGIIPVSWTGAYLSTYSDFLLKSLWIDYEGSDKASLVFNGGRLSDEEIAEGKNLADIIEGFKANGEPIIKKGIAITENNYDELSRQPGRYYALKFWEQIINNNYYSADSMNISQSHLEAQAAFLESRFLENSPTIAMLIEGTWWENEAKEAEIFSDMLKEFGEETAKDVRKLGFLPMPKATEDMLGKGESTIYEASGNTMFVNAKIADYRKALVKDFIQYSLTDESMNLFTADTGITRAFDYTITDDIRANLSYYSKSLLNVSENSVTTQIFTPKTALRVKIEDKYKGLLHNFSIVGGKQQNTFLNAFRYGDQYGNKITARAYFEGLYTYSKSV